MPRPNDRDEILEAFREGREAIDAIGLRRTYVYLRTRVWYTGVAAPWTPSTVLGRGYPVDTVEQVLPTPRVRSVSSHLIASSGGRFQSGDIRVDKITPRAEPATGSKLWPFTASPVQAGEERHVLLLERAGTAWHHREGTDRLLTPAPFNETTAVAHANALRAAYAAHWSDRWAHATADTTAAPGVAATAWASARALANALRAAWVAHRADLVRHHVADPYAVTAAVATDDQTTLVLLHDLHRVFNAHVAHGAFSECEVVEAHADRAFSHEVIVRPTRRTP